MSASRAKASSPKRKQWPFQGRVWTVDHLAIELAKPYERGRYEQWRRIIEVQATIDAIDRAITDERSIKDKGKPVSLMDLG